MNEKRTGLIHNYVVLRYKYGRLKAARMAFLCWQVNARVGLDIKVRTQADTEVKG